MAALTKQSGKKVGKKAGGGKKSSSKHIILESEEVKDFAILRLVLDTFQMRAIEHYAAGKTPAARRKRAKRIHKHVFNVVENEFGGPHCKPPYCYCEGMCLLCMLCGRDECDDE